MLRSEEDIENINIKIYNNKAILTQTVPFLSKLTWLVTAILFSGISLKVDNFVIHLISISLIVFSVFSLIKKKELIIDKSNKIISTTLYIGNFSSLNQFLEFDESLTISCVYEMDADSDISHTFYATNSSKLKLITCTRHDTQQTISKLISEFLNLIIIYQDK